jgi:hypothetical protein
VSHLKYLFVVVNVFFGSVSFSAVYDAQTIKKGPFTITECSSGFRKYACAADAWGNHADSEAISKDAAGWIMVIAEGEIAKDVTEIITWGICSQLQENMHTKKPEGPIDLFSNLFLQLNKEYKQEAINSTRSYQESLERRIKNISVMLQFGKRHILLQMKERSNLQGAFFVPEFKVIQDEELFVRGAKWEFVLQDDANSPCIVYDPHN